jgi:hypothetical protein
MSVRVFARRIRFSGLLLNLGLYSGHRDVNTLRCLTLVVTFGDERAVNWEGWFDLVLSSVPPIPLPDSPVLKEDREQNPELRQPPPNTGALSGHWSGLYLEGGADFQSARIQSVDLHSIRIVVGCVSHLSSGANV